MVKGTLSIKDAAKRLNYSPNRLRERVREEGYLKGFHIGRQWRIPEEEVKRAEAGQNSHQEPLSSTISRLRQVAVPGGRPVDLAAVLLDLADEFATGLRLPISEPRIYQRFPKGVEPRWVLAQLRKEGLVTLVPGPRLPPNERGVYASAAAVPYDTWYSSDRGVDTVRGISGGQMKEAPAGCSGAFCCHP